MDYIRIGTTYYKSVRIPQAFGESYLSIIPWTLECIRQDHGKPFLLSVPKYDGFCMVPDHFDYQKIIDNFYNRYHPFEHKPKPGYPGQSLEFIHHIFGEQAELGLDYLKILLLYPVQILPILCLVSAERNTGKTTFLNYLKAIFTDNMILNRNHDLRSNFNAEWTDKLIIAVEETSQDRKDDSERLKHLSTAKYYKTEAKGKDRQESKFFGKFILCSNKEDDFVNIDQGEIRYWIRKIPVLSAIKQNFEEELKAEIPYFLQYLIDRPFSTKCTTRMWFQPGQIATKALQRVKNFSRTKLEVEMSQILISIMDIKDGLKEICFCVADMQDWLLKKGFRGPDNMSIRRVLQDKWKLQPSPNSNAYLQYRLVSDGTIMEYPQKGRFYKVSEKEVLKLNNLDDSDEQL